jgi:hypothetical protein
VWFQHLTEDFYMADETKAVPAAAPVAVTAAAKPVSGPTAMVVPPGAAGPKFALGDRVKALPARAFGTVTGGRWQSSQWCYEVAYEVTTHRSTWFESQLVAAPKGGAA